MTTRLILLFVAVGLLCPSLWAASAEDAFAQGQHYADIGAFDQAVDNFYKALSIKEDCRFHLALGNAHNELGNKELAFYSFRNAWGLLAVASEDRVGVATQLVSLSLDLHRWGDCEKYLPTLGELDPQVAETARFRLALERGYELLDAKSFGAAYRSLSQARKIDADDGRVRDGMQRTLEAMAIELEQRQEWVRLIDVLLQLGRIAPSEQVSNRLRVVFEKAGRPRNKALRVEKFLQRLDDK